MSDDEEFVPISSIHQSFIGRLRKDGVLVMVRNEKEHVYRKHNGICISTDILIRLAGGKLMFVKHNQPCVKMRMILKRENGEDVYETTPSFWIQEGIVVDHGERQTCLPLEKWQLISPQLSVEEKAPKDFNELLSQLQVRKLFA